MNKLTLIWAFKDIDEDKVERYCHNCNKKVLFADSLKRRKNANGKNIYEYAIYKCERGHTWNKLTNTCKTHTDINGFIEEEMPEVAQGEIPKEIFISEAMAVGVQEIEIVVKRIKTRQRIDKLLAQYVADLSRTKIKLWIERGCIQIDNVNVKPDTLVSNQQTILIKL